MYLLGSLLIPLVAHTGAWTVPWLLTGTVTPGQLLSLLASYLVLFGTALYPQIHSTRRREPTFTEASPVSPAGEEE